MQLHLQRYKVTIMYHCGKEMLLVDTYSCYSLQPRDTVTLDVAIHQIVTQMEGHIPGSHTDQCRDAKAGCR